MYLILASQSSHLHDSQPKRLQFLADGYTMVQLEIEIVIVHKESELILAIPSVIQCRTIPTWHSNYPRDNIYIYMRMQFLYSKILNCAQILDLRCIDCGIKAVVYSAKAALHKTWDVRSLRHNLELSLE
jgi:hypothetical protein